MFAFAVNFPQSRRQLRRNLISENRISRMHWKFPVSPKVIETLAPPHRHHLASNSLDLARNKPGKKKNRLLIREGKESSENHRKKSRNSVTSSSRIYQPRRRARNINFSRVIRHSCKKKHFRCFNAIYNVALRGDEGEIRIRDWNVHKHIKPAYKNDFILDM